MEESKHQTSKSKSKDIELEVGKKAKILLNGKEINLDAAKVRQTTSVSYESELEVVTKIGISGLSAAESETTKQETEDDAHEFESLLPEEGLDGWYLSEDPKGKRPNWENNKNGLRVFKAEGLSPRR